MSDIEVISNLFLFRSVPDRALRELCILAPPVQFPPGSTIFEQGAVSDVALLLVSGSLGVEVVSGGERRAVGTVNPGEIVGETALFTRGGTRSATVRASEQSQCLLLNWDVLERGANNPAIVAVERHLLGTLARRIRRTNREITALWKESADTPPEAAPGGGLVDKLKSLFGARQ